jgi:hypothetical protein
MTRKPNVSTGLWLAVLLAGTGLGAVSAQQHWGDPGDYVYRVETLQAAPGRMFDLMDLYRGYFDELEAVGEERPMWMRHSQGDQWDLMIVYPVGTMAGYFGDARASARARLRTREAEMNRITGWREELFARGPALAAVRQAYDAAGFFHVEMFVGLPGKREELLKQRRMENDYYTNIRERGNAIFTRVAGAQFDSFTIGFYQDLKDFADTGDAMTDEQDRQAQADAGFTPGEIGLYLRSLLLHHHDTLAVRIPD